jgi:hypothetical protein
MSWANSFVLAARLFAAEALLWSSPKGGERRAGGRNQSVCAHLLAKVWRLSARRPAFCSASGRAFAGNRPVVSELLAGGS